MLTPKFLITQDDTHLSVLVIAPYSNIKDAEIDVDGQMVTFSAKPYYLRLNLPDKVIDDETCSAQYDADSGSYTIRLRKMEAKHFDGLEMISELLRPPNSETNQCASGSAIEEVDCSAEYEVQQQEEDFEWFVQNLAVDSAPVLAASQGDSSVSQAEVELQEKIAAVSLLDKSETGKENIVGTTGEPAPIILVAPKYGFANSRQGNLRICDEPCDAFDLGTPERISETERIQLAFEAESRDFDAECYLADSFDDERLATLRDALHHHISWRAPFCDKHTSGSTNCDSCFSEPEHTLLRRLANRRRVLVDRSTLNGVLFGLVDLLLAAAYDERTCGGESTCESAWTVRKMAASCSCLLTFSSLRHVLVSFTRRVLTYSVLRNWQLAMRCIRDVEKLLRSAGSATERDSYSSGRLHILRTLVRVYRLFEREGPGGPALNDLIVADFITFVQHAKLSRHLAALADALGAARTAMVKRDVQLEIDEYELGAQLAIREAEAADATGEYEADE